MNTWKRWLGWTAFGVAGLGGMNLIGLAIAARRARRPANLGAADGRLAACPDTPNCAASQSGDAKQRMDPIPYSTSTAEARRRLLEIIRSSPRTEIVAETPTYLGAVYRSKLFGFPDDVEFLFDEERRVIDFRSASRVGGGDLGVNRARMLAISRAFAAAERD
ncbi:MAG TPA: DUF1499 domain-containing protein [Herpetosiphonaceae bacterium]|nr:DUF1499 domain-containing protein [Herpetosiphonaceae bacterium]